jgi:hypothetical protein
LVVVEFGTSRQRPDATPTTWLPGCVLPPCGPAAAITACAPAGQAPLVTVMLLETTLPRSPLVTFVLPFVVQLPVTVKLPMFSAKK